MEPQTFAALEHKLLNQHHEHYVAFTRLILSLAVGSFSLLTALSDNLLEGKYPVALAKAAFPLLLVSILAGIFVQHRIMMSPLWHLDYARALAQQKPESDSAIEARRRPSILERWFYSIQTLSFLTAFAVLAAFMWIGKAP